MVSAACRRLANERGGQRDTTTGTSWTKGSVMTVHRLQGWQRLLVSSVLATALVAATVTDAVAAVVYDDTPIPAWRVNGVTRSVLVDGDTTYVGGDFTHAVAPNGETVPRANLAAFDTATGELIRGFRADTNGIVRALDSDGSTLWVGGSFRRVSGVRRDRLAAVDAATGELRSFRANANSNVYGLDYHNGRVFAVGSFSWIGGVNRARLAAVDATTGTVDGQWNPGADQTAHAVVADPAGDVIYVGGNFRNAGGATRTGVVALRADTGAATAPAFSNSYANVQALDIDESAGRLFGAVGAAGNQVAAWDTDSGARVWRRRADGDVQAVAYHDGTVYFGFHESYDDDPSLRLLAADAGTGALDNSFDPSFDRYWGVRAISASSSGLAAAGDFTQVSGVAAQGLALFPPTTAPPSGGTETRNFVTAASLWRYLDDGTEPAGWSSPGFDDGSWDVGTAELGYGDGDESTVLSFGPDSSDRYITYYFRTSFDVDVLPTSASAQLLADDGAVVYLNGQEVVRDNMPSGTITSTTTSATGRWGEAERTFRTFDIDQNAFVEGNNVIAVEVHQRSSNSSDLSLDLRLDGRVPTE